jgi:hypothetical protein
MFPRSLQWAFCMFWQIFLFVGFIKQPGSLLSLGEPTDKLLGQAPWPRTFSCSDLGPTEFPAWRSPDIGESLSGLPGQNDLKMEPLDKRQKKRNLGSCFEWHYCIMLRKDTQRQVYEKVERLPWGIQTILTPVVQIWTFYTSACHTLFLIFKVTSP